MGPLRSEKIRKKIMKRQECAGMSRKFKAETLRREKDVKRGKKRDYIGKEVRKKNMT